MKKITVSMLFFLVLVASSLSACSSAAPSEPTPTLIPTATTTPIPTPTEERIESGFFTNADGDWKPVYEDELSGPVFLPEEMSGDMGTDNQMIHYGYFKSFDSNTNILSMYARIILVDLYREIDIQLDQRKEVHCLPEIIEDTPIENIAFIYNQNSVSFPPGTGKAQFNDLAANLDTHTYIVSVLDAPIQADQINILSSLALICP